jgi:zinc-binding alcohol dehydrogenase family protein
MRAVGFSLSLPVDHPEALRDLQLPPPSPGPRDLLVEIGAVSVNPVDAWIRRSARPDAGEPVVLGMDAVGVVRDIGAGVSTFARGDRVWYSGSFLRPGTHAELHCVDERLVARAPANLDPASAAALPLTAITAWELLFERLEIPAGEASAGGVLLVSGAAGGVGSILLQLARRLTGITVVATASRPETARWVQAMGAHHVVDHTRPLAPQLAAAGLDGVTHVASLTGSAQNYPRLVEVLRPRGRLGLIDAPGPMDLRLLMPRNQSAHYEDMGMVTKLLEGDAWLQHHRILGRVTELVEAGILRTTMTEHLGRIEAGAVRRAHARLESGRTIGKLVLAGF